MANLETFKGFVRKNPILIKHVKSGTMSWQKFYEIYDLYGEDEVAWKDYLQVEKKQEAVSNAATAVGIADIFAWLKTLDLDSVQSGISSLQRVLGVVQDFSGKSSSTEKKEDYKPRPLYKHFED